MQKIKVIDVIKHKNQYGYQIFFVVNKYPNFTYERKTVNGTDWLVATDGIFKNFYYKQFDRYANAFAGRRFKIQTVNGIEEAHGQWWDGIMPNSRCTSVGISTIDDLSYCNVFSSIKITVKEYLRILRQFKFCYSNNYNLYNKKSKQFGLRQIKSKFE